LLTLVAIGVQLAVAGFHHHPGHGSLMQSRAMTAGLCAPSRAIPCVPAPHQHDSDGCVLCWATAIAATSLMPAAPQLPAPQSLVVLRLGGPDSVPLIFVYRTNFQARGPPTAIPA
jgi:hypothetical protein